MEVLPYLHFNGDCEEALTFYKAVLGGEITSMMRFEEMPSEGMPSEGNIPPDYQQKIMHATFESPGMKVMASDGCPGAVLPSGSRLSLSVHTKDVPEGERVFARLSEGGTVTLPLHDAFWNARFGTVIDKFGIYWMINAEKS